MECNLGLRKTVKKDSFLELRYIPIRHFHNVHNALSLLPKVMRSHCFQFLLGLTIVPREIENNAYVQFLGVNKVHYGQCGSGE